MVKCNLEVRNCTSVHIDKDYEAEDSSGSTIFCINNSPTTNYVILSFDMALPAINSAVK